MKSVKKLFYSSYWKLNNIRLDLTCNLGNHCEGNYQIYLTQHQSMQLSWLLFPFTFAPNPDSNHFVIRQIIENEIRNKQYWLIWVVSPKTFSICNPFGSQAGIFSDPNYNIIT